MGTQHHPSATGWFRSRSGLVLIAFLAIAAFFIVTEHTAHVLGVLPFLLVLLCPLLHLFLHGRHGRSHDGHESGPNRRAAGGQR